MFFLFTIIMISGTIHTMMAEHRKPIRCLNYTEQTIIIQDVAGNAIPLPPNGTEKVLLDHRVPFDWQITSERGQPSLRSSFFKWSKHIDFCQSWSNAKQTLCSPDTGGWKRTFELIGISYFNGLTCGLIGPMPKSMLTSDRELIAGARGSGAASIIIALCAAAVIKSNFS